MLYQHRPGRTITEADNVLFTTLTMNTQALHLDAAFSDALPPFNQRLVNSMFTLSTLVGLSVAQLTQGTIVGNLGFGEVAFPKPLFHGDTLYAETEVTDKRESKSRPGEGIVTFAHTGRNQHGDVVATASRKTMVRKRPDEEAVVALDADRARLAVLPGRPPGAVREGRGGSRCGDPRPRGRCRGEGPGGGARSADRHPAGPRRAPSCGSTPPPPTTTRRTSRRCATTKYTTVMLAKTEDPQQVRDLAPLDVVVLIETPLGAVAVNETGAHRQRVRR